MLRRVSSTVGDEGDRPGLDEMVGSRYHETEAILTRTDVHSTVERVGLHHDLDSSFRLPFRRDVPFRNHRPENVFCGDVNEWPGYIDLGSFRRGRSNKRFANTQR